MNRDIDSAIVLTRTCVFMVETLFFVFVCYTVAKMKSVKKTHLVNILP